MRAEGEPPGLSRGNAAAKARFLIPIGVPEDLFDERFTISEDMNLDANIVTCAEAQVPALESMLKQWDTPYVRVEPGRSTDDDGLFDKARNDYEVLETINDLEKNANLIKTLIDTPEIFSKSLGVSLNFSDPALVVRVIGTIKPAFGGLVRPLLDGSAKIFTIKKELFNKKLSAVEYN